MIVNELNRVFVHKENGQEVRLADPSSTLTKEEVQNFYANLYPILTTAKIRGPEIVNDEVVYHFETSMGTKG
jgi:PRTRC genetic system protein C